jgi:hypothetical protein
VSGQPDVETDLRAVFATVYLRVHAQLACISPDHMMNDLIVVRLDRNCWHFQTGSKEEQGIIL